MEDLENFWEKMEALNLLRHSCDELKVQNTMLFEEAEKMRKEMPSLLEMKRQATQIEILQKEHQNLQKVHDDLEGALVLVKTTSGSVDDLQAQTVIASNLASDNQKLLLANEDLTSEVNAVKVAISASKAEFVSQIAQIENWTKENEKLSAENTKLKSQIDQAKLSQINSTKVSEQAERLQKLIAENKFLVDEGLSLQSDLDLVGLIKHSGPLDEHLTLQLSDAVTKLNNSSYKMQKLEQENIMVEESKKQLILNTLDLENDSIESLRSTMKQHFESQLNNFEKEKMMAEDQEMKIKKSIGEVEKKEEIESVNRNGNLAKMEKDMKQMESNGSTVPQNLQQNYNHVKEKKHMAEAELESLKGQMRSCEENKKQASDRITKTERILKQLKLEDDLRDNNAALLQKVSEMESGLDSLQTDMQTMRIERDQLLLDLDATKQNTARARDQALQKVENEYKSRIEKLRSEKSEMNLARQSEKEETVRQLEFEKLQALNDVENYYKQRLLEQDLQIKEIESQKSSEILKLQLDKQETIDLIVTEKQSARRQFDREKTDYEREAERKFKSMMKAKESEVEAAVKESSRAKEEISRLVEVLQYEQETAIRNTYEFEIEERRKEETLSRRHIMDFEAARAEINQLDIALKHEHNELAKSAKMKRSDSIAKFELAKSAEIKKLEDALNLAKAKEELIQKDFEEKLKKSQEKSVFLEEQLSGANKERQDTQQLLLKQKEESVLKIEAVIQTMEIRGQTLEESYEKLQKDNLFEIEKLKAKLKENRESLLQTKSSNVALKLEKESTVKKLETAISETVAKDNAIDMEFIDIQQEHSLDLLKQQLHLEKIQKELESQVIVDSENQMKMLVDAISESILQKKTVENQLAEEQSRNHSLEFQIKNESAKKKAKTQSTESFKKEKETVVRSLQRQSSQVSEKTAELKKLIVLKDAAIANYEAQLADAKMGLQKQKEVFFEGGGKEKVDSFKMEKDAACKELQKSMSQAKRLHSEKEKQFASLDLENNKKINALMEEQKAVKGQLLEMEINAATKETKEKNEEKNIKVGKLRKLESSMEELTIKDATIQKDLDELRKQHSIEMHKLYKKMENEKEQMMLRIVTDHEFTVESLQVVISQKMNEQLESENLLKAKVAETQTLKASLELDKCFELSRPKSSATDKEILRLNEKISANAASHQNLHSQLFEIQKAASISVVEMMSQMNAALKERGRLMEQNLTEKEERMKMLEEQKAQAKKVREAALVPKRTKLEKKLEQIVEQKTSEVAILQSALTVSKEEQQKLSAEHQAASSSTQGKQATRLSSMQKEALKDKEKVVDALLKKKDQTVCDMEKLLEQKTVEMKQLEKENEAKLQDFEKHQMRVMAEMIDLDFHQLRRQNQFDIQKLEMMMAEEQEGRHAITERLELVVEQNNVGERHLIESLLREKDVCLGRVMRHLGMRREWSENMRNDQEAALKILEENRRKTKIASIHHSIEREVSIDTQKDIHALELMLRQTVVDRNQSMSKFMNQLQNTINDQSQERGKHIAQQDAALRKIRILEQKIGDLGRELDNNLLLLEQMSSQIEKKEEIRRSLEEEIRYLKERLGQLQGSVKPDVSSNSLNSFDEVGRLRQSATQLLREKDILAGRLEKKEDQLAEMSVTAANSAAQAANAVDELNTVKQTLNTVLDQHAVLKQAVDSSEAERHSLERVVESRVSELEMISAVLDETVHHSAVSVAASIQPAPSTVVSSGNFLKMAEVESYEPTISQIRTCSRTGRREEEHELRKVRASELWFDETLYDSLPKVLAPAVRQSILSHKSHSRKTDSSVTAERRFTHTFDPLDHLHNPKTLEAPRTLLEQLRTPRDQHLRTPRGISFQGNAGPLSPIVAAASPPIASYPSKLYTVGSGSTNANSKGQSLTKMSNVTSMSSYNRNIAMTPITPRSLATPRSIANSHITTRVSVKPPNEPASTDRYTGAAVAYSYGRYGYQ
eukprot:Platyproteum_vivax@DN7651_c0_g1_i1.p1